ncbi:hypothetical protein H112_01307 [Trichophyton rubrum D6]|nr:hypothetical protein H113_01306 [Trichophyton rubrum MR1459]EZG05605.1 hypothetical protein H106_04641 [Trichophyton rubrum CBS 735.88]KDB37327.1 hypothetical protein H112_01307 [Trichophyton rubrum D6]
MIGFFAPFGSPVEKNNDDDVEENKARQQKNILHRFMSSVNFLEGWIWSVNEDTNRGGSLLVKILKANGIRSRGSKFRGQPTRKEEVVSSYKKKARELLASIRLFSD